MIRPSIASGSTLRLLRLAEFLAVPNCAPAAIFAVLTGVACIALGWWRGLPAILPGDELFNIERVAGLVLRSLIGWSQPPDAPATPRLTGLGIGFVIAGIVILAIGMVLSALWAPINNALIRRSRNLRLVVLGDAAAAAIAAEPTHLTNVLLGNPSLIGSKTGVLSARLDAGFLSNTLPRCASAVRELLAFGVDANTNINLARRLIALRQELAAPQLDRLFVRIDPRELRSSIGRDGFLEFALAAADARLTSLPEARCRCLLRDQPPSKVRLIQRDGRPAIVVIGLGETGLELLARLCSQAQSPSYDPLTMVLVDTEAPAVAREVLELWPALTLAAQLAPIALEAHLPQSAASLFRHLHQQGLVPTCVYVALDDASLASAWEHEIGLAVRLFGQESPLVLPVGGAAENDRLLLAEEETLELLQRQLHADYRENDRNTDGRTPPEWSRLPFDLLEDNRSVADHLWTKARDLDARIVAGHDPSATPSEEQIEELAAAEHRRWIASRAIAGWRFGAIQAESERTHPSMIPWIQLTESERSKDRDVIRQIPRVLRAAGLFLQRLVSFSVARTGVNEASADALAAEAQNLALDTAGAAPRLVIAVEDARSFRLAKRLSEIPGVAVSFVLAQPMIGLAIAADCSPQAASKLANAAQSIWITLPDAIDAILGRWPTLGGGAP